MTKIVTVSAAAVGTDLVQSELDAADVLAEAEAAVLRAKLNGRNRIERVALLPTVAHHLRRGQRCSAQSPHDVARLIREGTLKATRRGRHYPHRPRPDRGVPEDDPLIRLALGLQRSAPHVGALRVRRFARSRQL